MHARTDITIHLCWPQEGKKTKTKKRAKTIERKKMKLDEKTKDSNISLITRKIMAKTYLKWHRRFSTETELSDNEIADALATNAHRSDQTNSNNKNNNNKNAPSKYCE